MSLSVAQMIATIRRDTGIDVNDLDDAAVTLCLNRSWWEVADKFEFREKEASTTFNTVAGTVLYPAPNPYEAIQGLYIEDVNSQQRTPLRFMEDFEYETLLVNNTDSRGTPTRYFRKNNNIGLWPTPDAVYPIYEDYLMTLADLVAVAPPIPQVWHEPIMFGGTYRCYLAVGDKVNASYFRKEQADMINTTSPTKSKEEKTDMRWAGLSVPRRWPDDSPISGRRIN
jgi:hypothetical protein